MGNYQLDFASKWPSMYDKKQRRIKANRIVKLLNNYYGPGKIKDLTVLDVGASTGIIDDLLAKHFKKVVGIDIDKGAIKYAKKNFNKKNLLFKVGDAMDINYSENSFDVVICTQVYEHVPNAEKLFSQIHKVLKPEGVCYLSAINRLRFWEPHYNLPLLSILPKPLGNFYVKLFRKADKYHESLKTYWGLKKITNNFFRKEYTDRILNSPNIFGYSDILPKNSLKRSVAHLSSPIAKYMSPNLIWLLVKK